MGDAWFTGVADELARCLVDAHRCADAAEALLETLGRSTGTRTQQAVLDALLAPAAVSRVLIELLDHPPELTLAAALLLRGTAESAAAMLDELRGDVDTSECATALRAAAESAQRLVDASRL